MKDVPGDILPQSEVLGKDQIVLRTFNHVKEAEIREARAAVLRNRIHYRLTAARHEFVRDTFR